LQNFATVSLEDFVNFPSDINFQTVSEVLIANGSICEKLSIILTFFLLHSRNWSPSSGLSGILNRTIRCSLLTPAAYRSNVFATMARLAAVRVFQAHLTKSLEEKPLKDGRASKCFIIAVFYYFCCEILVFRGSMASGW